MKKSSIVYLYPEAITMLRKNVMFFQAVLGESTPFLFCSSIDYDGVFLNAKIIIPHPTMQKRNQSRIKKSKKLNIVSGPGTRDFQIPLSFVLAVFSLTSGEKQEIRGFSIPEVDKNKGSVHRLRSAV